MSEITVGDMVMQVRKHGCNAPITDMYRPFIVRHIGVTNGVSICNSCGQVAEELPAGTVCAVISFAGTHLRRAVPFQWLKKIEPPKQAQIREEEIAA